MSDLELTYQIYRYAYFTIIILAVIAGICDLVRKSNKDALAFQYKQILNKYHADVAMYFRYETGIDGVPENSLAWVFADEFSVGIKLVNSEFKQIIRLKYGKINWMGGLQPDQTLDIPLNLPQIPKPRLIFSYKDGLLSNDKYIVLNLDISEFKNAIEMNQYVFKHFAKPSNSLIRYLRQYIITDCPHHLIHPIYDNEEQILNL